MKKTIVSLVAVLFIALVPVAAGAQEGFVPCIGLECNTCHLVDMGNTILNWLIGILFVVFGVVVALAGWGLATSAGNQAALNDAKSKFTNAFIGLFIVLAAWLIVDTIMRGLISTGDGTREGFGPWSQVECVTPRETSWEETDIEFGDVPDGGVMTTSAPRSCDVGPSGERVLCGRLTTECESTGGTAVTDTSNPSNHTVSCDTPVGVADPSTTSEVCDAGPSGDRVLCSRLQNECTAGGGSPIVDTENPNAYRVTCVAASPTGACQEGEMSRINLFGRGVTVHNSIRDRLESIDAQWRSNGGNSFYNVYSVGAYNCRRITNGSRYSVHAYGLAVDINPRDNPYHSKSGACRTNMPSSFSSLFTSRGFGWGANWRSVCDAMHFSGASNEGGWISI
jgi:co-chaperonin GroES (HSP10)